MLAATDLRITEFLASNDDGLQDVDGDSSDWIEIYNAGPTAVDMGGLHLTDNANNKTKWKFPAGSMIEAGGYRVIFASNKNGIRGNGELHTNFALSAGGEYLGLIAADGVTVIDQYAPQFPPQFEDVSYGRAMEISPTTTTLIATGAQARAWVPTSSVYDATWRNVNFNDAVFNIVGPTGLGYENNPGDAVNFTAEIATPVPANIRSLYMRISFDLTSLAGIDQLMLRMKFDDGFIAYINGQKVAERNAPEGAQWNSQATTTHPDNLAKQFINFDVSAALPALRVGQNVLAIHGLNQPTGSDMLISPELVASAATIVTPERIGYFENPTPGYGNGWNYLGFLDRPTFSVPHGFYSTVQSVAITSSEPGTVIVYTTNGSTPAVNASLTPTNGTLYTGPITVSATTTLRAMAFKAEYRASFVTASSYLFVNDIVNQSPQGQTPPGFAPNGVNGQEMNYGIDPDIIALYGLQTVKDSLLAIPSISVTTDLANLFNASTGIYVNALNDGRDWERPSTVELIHPDGSAGFTVNAGLRIRGGYSRNDFNPKHAFRFYFRSEYGDGKLRYPWFE
ncbi:MAG TPA: lamin tail domain-containing protein, partial [Lacipirellulaceae bacterium]|nr:lamin tail domain-containing protein [Lacipirellulaceae bacterium]